MGLEVLDASHVHAGQLQAHPVGQHHHYGLVPALWHLQLPVQVAYVHDLARVPNGHLVEGVLGRWPKNNLALRNCAVEPILERLVGCEVLVWQVREVVAVQAGHRDLSRVVAQIPFAQVQRGAVVGPDPVEGNRLAIGNVSPHPLVVHHGNGAEVSQGVPCGTVLRVFVDD